MKSLREHSPRFSQHQLASLRIIVLAAAGLGCNLSLSSGLTAASPQVIVITATGGPAALPGGGMAQTTAPDATIAPTITPTFTLQPTAGPRMSGFLACLTECRADGSNAVRAVPEKTTKVHARWNYENIPAGARYTRSWSNQGQEWVRYDCAWPGPETGADAITLTEPYGLRSGVWTMTITVGGKVMLQETLEVQGDWDFWDPAGTFNTCYGKAASGPGPGRIAFASERDDDDGEIYLMDADGSHVTRITNDPDRDLYPSWSPDGSRIAFVSHRAGTYDIFVMDADGSNVTRLGYGRSPAWSPDGRRIANEEDGIIFIMDSDGSNMTQLTSDDGWNLSPAWSPDGNRIAFTSRRNGFYDQIFVMDTDGSNVTQLTDSPFDKGFPDWSPDGKHIAFSSDPFDRLHDGSEIYVIDVDGSHETGSRLTDNLANDAAPSWSPDGKRIAFQSDRDGNYEIYVMDADGSNVIRLTNNPAYDLDPDW